jgi:GT2 family glycosyltransferase
MIFGTLVRIFCKFYELILRIYTILCRGFQSDCSSILVESYTKEQTIFQEKLDKALGKKFVHGGELLVIIPFRDRWDLTEKCLINLSAQILNTGVQVKTLLINNRSQLKATSEALMAATSRYPVLNIQILQADYDFNYSRLNNDGFQKFATSATSWVLFLNNDVELNDRTIVQRMLEALECLPEVGVVGCSLLYPSRRIQHLFAAPGVKIIAAHPLRGQIFSPKMDWFAKPARVVPAVTGAVMLMSSDDFVRVGMFDQRLATLGQDVIMCFETFSKLNKITVVVNTGDVIHHESLTKKPTFPKEEVFYIYEAYACQLRDSRWYSKKFSRWSEKPILALPWEPKYPVKSVIRAWN